MFFVKEVRYMKKKVKKVTKKEMKTIKGGVGNAAERLQAVRKASQLGIKKIY